MKIIRDPFATSGNSSATSDISDPEIRALVNLRFAQLCEGSGDDPNGGSDDPYDADQLGYFVIVEPGDTVAALEKEVGCPILHNYFEPEIKFGHPDFVHSAEILEKHRSCFEMVFILGGDYAISLFIPKPPNAESIEASKAEGIDSDLLAMCSKYAEPAPDLAEA